MSGVMRFSCTAATAFDGRLRSVSSRLRNCILALATCDDAEPPLEEAVTASAAAAAT
jgi:hypothetical protein